MSVCHCPQCVCVFVCVQPGSGEGVGVLRCISLSLRALQKLPVVYHTTTLFTCVLMCPCTSTCALWPFCWSDFITGGSRDLVGKWETTVQVTSIENEIAFSLPSSHLSLSFPVLSSLPYSLVYWYTPSLWQLYFYYNISLWLLHFSYFFLGNTKIRIQKQPHEKIWLTKCLKYRLIRSKVEEKALETENCQLRI